MLAILANNNLIYIFGYSFKTQFHPLNFAPINVFIIFKRPQRNATGPSEQKNNISLQKTELERADLRVSPLLLGFLPFLLKTHVKTCMADIISLFLSLSLTMRFTGYHVKLIQPRKNVQVQISMTRPTEDGEHKTEGLRPACRTDRRETD